MLAIMTSLKKFMTNRHCGEREYRFISSTLDYLTSVTGEQLVDIDSWTITAYDVEFGAVIGSGGL
jgi:hypothetical protein